jgi:ABC-type antimicrobial peptide transport system permease subunit
VIVNETFADRHFRGTSAIGKRIDISGDGGKWVTIVGVVKEIRERGITIATKPAVYMPLAQSDGYWPVPADLAIRTAVDPASIAKPVRDAVGSVDRLQPISDIRTMDAVVDEALARQDQQTTLLSAFALLALALAATGIYGVITYAVSLRKKEIGVRMALGATPGAILRLVLTRGLGIVGLGVAAGIALALIGTRLLRSLLDGVEPQDPLTLAGAALALLLVALVACAVPARSASRVDPMVVLREE